MKNLQKRKPWGGDKRKQGKQRERVAGTTWIIWKIGKCMDNIRDKWKGGKIGNRIKEYGENGIFSEGYLAN